MRTLREHIRLKPRENTTTDHRPLVGKRRLSAGAQNRRGWRLLGSLQPVRTMEASRSGGPHYQVWADVQPAEPAADMPKVQEPPGKLPRPSCARRPRHPVAD